MCQAWLHATDTAVNEVLLLLDFKGQTDHYDKI